MDANNFFDKVDKNTFRKYLNDSVLRAQRCQRNWDLSKEIPEEDLDLIVHAALNCPSKQNQDFYNVHVIRNRDLIEELYEASITPSGNRKNPQLLANVVLLFEQKDPEKIESREELRRFAGIAPVERDNVISAKDANQAAGVAAGFVNVVASSLGYQTGCCTCFHDEIAKAIFELNGKPMLAMGVGIKNEDKPRREDHDTGNLVESFNKGPIRLKYHD